MLRNAKRIGLLLDHLATPTKVVAACWTTMGSDASRGTIRKKKKIETIWWHVPSAFYKKHQNERTCTIDRRRPPFKSTTRTRQVIGSRTDFAKISDSSSASAAASASSVHWQCRCVMFQRDSLEMRAARKVWRTWFGSNVYWQRLGWSEKKEVIFRTKNVVRKKCLRRRE